MHTSHSRGTLAGLAIALGVLVLAGAATAQSGPGIEPFGRNAWLNWEAAVLKARGFGHAPAETLSPAHGVILARRVAILDGYRALLEVSLGVLVRSKTVVERSGVRWDTIEAQAEGLVRGAELVAEQAYPDGRYEVILQMPLYGQRGLGQLVIPPLIPQKPDVTLPPVPSPDPNAQYTGLVIVVKGMRLDRSMSPAVLTPRGEVVYGRGWWRPGEVSQEFANRHGVVGYPSSRATARRAGPRPLVIMAIGVSGPPQSEFKTDVIISEEDAERIRAANASSRFLERFLVDIVAEP
jgi:hypothetical protein